MQYVAGSRVECRDHLKPFKIQAGDNDGQHKYNKYNCNKTCPNAGFFIVLQNVIPFLFVVGVFYDFDPLDWFLLFSNKKGRPFFGQPFPLL